MKKQLILEIVPALPLLLPRTFVSLLVLVQLWFKAVTHHTEAAGKAPVAVKG